MTEKQINNAVNWCKANLEMGRSKEVAGQYYNGLNLMKDDLWLKDINIVFFGDNVVKMIPMENIKEKKII